MRAHLWRLLWGLAFLIWVPRFRVVGRIPHGPVVFAANHNSHADTAAIQLALARERHSTVLTAGAEDYFFRNRLISACSRLIGVFPFPRSGRAGIDRAIRLLESGSSVVIYPEGSRRGGHFRPGVSYLARAGYSVVPVTILGTKRLLPKGRLIPVRSDVSVRFGPRLRLLSGETPESFAARLEGAVKGKDRISVAEMGFERRRV